MTESINQGKGKLYTLKQIIELTGDTHTKSAYSLLRKNGKEAVGYKGGKGAALALFREEDVRDVFAKHLAKTARILHVNVDDLFSESQKEVTVVIGAPAALETVGADA